MSLWCWTGGGSQFSLKPMKLRLSEFISVGSHLEIYEWAVMMTVGIWSSLYVAMKHYFNNDTERKKIDWIPPVAETEQSVSSSLHCRHGASFLQDGGPSASDTVMSSSVSLLTECSHSFHTLTHVCLVLCAPLFLYLLSHLCFSSSPLSQWGGGTDAA